MCIPIVQCCTVTTTQHILSTDQNSAVQCTPHSSAVTSKPSHFCTQIVSTRNFYSAVKSTNTQNKNILEIVIHMAEDEIVDGMSRRAGSGEVRAKSQYCARLVPPAVDKCTRTCHGNNINNNQQPLKHVTTPCHPAYQMQIQEERGRRDCGNQRAP